MPAGFQPLELESSSLLPKSGAQPRSCEPEDLQHDKVRGAPDACAATPRPQGLQAGQLRMLLLGEPLQHRELALELVHAPVEPLGQARARRRLRPRG
mgnify:CR=1 FL=1